MKFIWPFFLLLASCASQPQEIYTPVAVDMPVPAVCPALPVPPRDLVGGLPTNASLTEFTKACAQQVLSDKSYILQIREMQNEETLP